MLLCVSLQSLLILPGGCIPRRHCDKSITPPPPSLEDSNSCQSNLKALLHHFSPFVNQEAGATDWQLLEEILQHDPATFLQGVPGQTTGFFPKFPNLNTLGATGS